MSQQAECGFTCQLEMTSGGLLIKTGCRLRRKPPHCIVKTKAVPSEKTLNLRSFAQQHQISEQVAVESAITEAQFIGERIINAGTQRCITEQNSKQRA